ncbi:MAG: UDP-glucose 4-epimerase GalE [Erysipelotrichaceae bacterium]|nr:UDP-glucose 4-epimerase GalE [Erysipelotrichaceae bacterium]
MNILVTGGTGYIGSHTVCELIKHGHNIVIVDNLYNSSIEVIDSIEEITGVKPIFYQVDITDKNELENVFIENNFDGIIHFAGYKAVAESCVKPMEYYRNNVSGSLNVYELAHKYHVDNIVFSSSATVYGDSFEVPFKEEYGLGNCTNPYGQTKKINELMLSDYAKAYQNMSVVLLRYFNPIGAHPSGLIGENPNGIPNNLVPYIAKVAIGELDHINVFGNDYNTIDGTGVRDYIHVVDLAIGHVLAIEYALKHKGCEVINLGTGHGSSVFEVIRAYEKACGQELKYEIKARRDGDIAECFADTEKAFKLLGFKTIYNIDEMCADSYRFMVKNLK